MLLLQLPPELLDCIASLLDPLALGQLRLTGQEAYSKTFHDFSRRVLGQQWLMREDSLNTLMAVGDDRQLKDSLTRLWLGTHALDEFHNPMRQLPRSTWDAFVSASKEQADFRAYGRPTAIITMVLYKTPALRDIEIGQFCQPNEDYRLGWGGNRLSDVTKQDLAPEWFNNWTPAKNPHPDVADTVPTSYKPDSSSASLSFNFSAVLMALSLTRQPIERLSAGLEKQDQMFGLDVDDLQTLDLAGSLCRGLAAAFANLKILRLALDYYDCSDHPDHHDEDHPNRDGWNWLPNLLGLTPQLRTLILYFEGLENQEGVTAENHAAFVSFAQKVHLPNLAVLELGSVVVDTKLLSDLLARHSTTLEEVSITNVGTPIANRAQGHAAAAWAGVLDALREMALNYVKLAWLYEEDRAMVTFCSAGIEECKECKRAETYDRKNNRQPTCKHLYHESKVGALPRAIGRLENRRGAL